MTRCRGQSYLTPMREALRVEWESHRVSEIDGLRASHRVARALEIARELDARGIARATATDLAVTIEFGTRTCA